MNSERTIISVYKTSTSPENVNRLQEVLDNFTKIIKWNIDLEDWVNILRIESKLTIKTLRIFITTFCDHLPLLSTFEDPPPHSEAIYKAI